jgi:mannose-6-phosphate isomerase-like protein (cupin superfamily)
VAEPAAGALPHLPGAVGVTHLRVYDTAGPDGLVGGSPHLHTACTEAYAVIGGTGSVQTLSGSGFDEVPLEAGSFVWFTPGTVHRLVNGGDLEILVLMGNAGLPEAGDLVLSFPDDVLADPAAYASAARLADDERTTAGTGSRRAGQARPRGRGVRRPPVGGRRGGTRCAGPSTGGRRRSSRIRVAAWRRVWEAGPARRVAARGALEALAAGTRRTSRLQRHRLSAPAAVRGMGCCGTSGTSVA